MGWGLKEGAAKRDFYTRYSMANNKQTIIFGEITAFCAPPQCTCHGSDVQNMYRICPFTASR